MNKVQRLKLVFASLACAVGIALLSRVFAIKELIDWEKTGIVVFAALVASLLVTLIFIKFSRKGIAIRRYTLIVTFLLSAAGYLWLYQKYVCDEDTSNILFMGSELKPDKKNPESIEKNNGGSRCELFVYHATFTATDIWTERSVKNAKASLVITYLLVVFLLVALFTHIVEEIILAIDTGQSNLPNRVFVSYNHADLPAATKLTSFLTSKSIPTIIDYNSMRPAAEIDGFIIESIKDSRITVFIVSQESLLSGWVATEIFNTYFLKKFDSSRTLIACYLDKNFMDADFTNRARKIIDDKLEKLRSITEGRDKLTTNEDIDPDMKRLISMRQNINSIIANLRGTLCLDISPESFDSSLNKLSIEIKRIFKS